MRHCLRHGAAMTGLYVMAAVALAYALGLHVGVTERDQLRSLLAWRGQRPRRPRRRRWRRLGERSRPRAAQALATARGAKVTELDEHLRMAEDRAHGHLEAFNTLRRARLEELRAAITHDQNGPHP